MIQSVILVIDDDKLWRNILTRFLAASNYKVHSAATCNDGIKLAGSLRPDCIVLDFHLTDGTAADVCLRVRSREDIKTTPIVVLSSDPDAEMIAYGECRADKFILKTVPLESILLSIEDLIASSALRTKRADGEQDIPGPALP